MTKRHSPIKTMTRGERLARVYDAMEKLCRLGDGINSMTISSGGRSVTIDRTNSARMRANAKAIAESLRRGGER